MIHATIWKISKGVILGEKKTDQRVLNNQKCLYDIVARQCYDRKHPSGQLMPGGEGTTTKGLGNLFGMKVNLIS